MTTILLAVTLFALWLMALAFMAGPRVSPLAFNEWHHGYLGLLLAVAGWLTGWVPLGAIGALLALDDAWQHGVQRFAKRPWYRSPVNRAHSLLYRIPLVARLNRWLDTRLR